MKKNKVIRCKSCGKISTTSASVTFKCSYCNKSEKIFKEREEGIAVNLIQSFENPVEASKFCTIIKEKIEGEATFTSFNE